MKKWIVDYITRNFKVWGVEFETDLPAEFVITTHAEQRLIERLRVKKEKLAKVVVKAWYTDDVPSAKVNRAAYNYPAKNKRYREMMGYTWVFGYGHESRSGLPPQKVLITVF